ncbi:eCIS core domain-containing protein [Haliangium sp.]|uniref:eCIS core domain-containing protein n=1 Tax=Haliangium sp. TaxID=2663208 RepID=UPI003D134068
MEKGPSSPEGPRSSTRKSTSEFVASGKVTRTSRLALSATQVVQPKAVVAGANTPRPKVKTASEWTNDPWMDAAHRGAVSPELLRAAPVQTKGAEEAEDREHVHSAAAAGVSGSGGLLPHSERIQRSFGPTYDLSQVHAHVGEAAAKACEAIGASAYATGHQVAFQSTPDLHTAAHEATHVIQQQQGGQLQGGVGQVGDAYERHADTVADAVVRGESAADLLGAGLSTAPARGATGASTRDLQMDRDDDADAHVVETSRKGGDSAPSRAKAIHEAFHGALFSEDEDQALQQLRGLGPASLRRLRSVYRAQYGAKIEDEFASYCDDAQATEALALLWPAIPVIDRLTRNTGLLGDNEDGMMDVLRTATRSELAVAAADARLQEFLDELSDGQQYEARRLIWPERAREHVLWRIERAHGTFNDDEGAVYSALLDLGASERRVLWDERDQHLSFLSERELAQVQRMCVGAHGGAATDAAALNVRMELATEGLGTDDDAVRLVVGRVASLAEEETRIRATLDAGTTSEGQALSAEQRAALEARLSEIGGVQNTLLTGERDHDGALADDSFLGRLHDDVGTGEYQAFTETMGSEAYARAKQQLLDAVGVFNDDEQAIYDAFRNLRAPLTLPPGHVVADYPPDELRRMQAEATSGLRRRLRSDPDLTSVWDALNQGERATLDAYVEGDSYRVALHELDAARGVNTDEARIVRIVAGMSTEDRARMVDERPRVYVDLMTDLDTDERALVSEVFRTGCVPTERALDVAMGGFGDGTDEDMLLGSLGAMSDEERRGYRLGYWLHEQGRTAGDVEGEPERAALARFTSLYGRLQSELDDEDLDAAMERLIGLPAPEDFLSPDGRRMAAEIMAHRHRERMAMSGGLTEAMTSTDETAEQAALIYEAHLQQLLARGGDISLEDFSVLVGLDAQFGGRFDEYRASVELVSNIAGTVAATVAAVVIVVLSEGTLAPAAAELISSSGGAALWAAVAGAGARVSASEAFGGDFHQTMSTEGARDALVGAIEGAVAVASAALAARAIELVGLGPRALGAEISRAAVDATEAGLALSGRGFARGSLEGAIDGFVSGAVGDLVMTATDAETWRRSIWETLGNLGMSLLRGGAFGAASGGVTGAAMHGGAAYLRRRGAGEVPETSSTAEPDVSAGQVATPVPEATGPVGTVSTAVSEAYEASRRRLLDNPQLATFQAYTYKGTMDWDYLGDPMNWVPERRALHDRLMARAMEHLTAFADAMDGPPTIYAMRGNTAAGKSRAIRGNIPALEDAVAATENLRHRAVNPDNFKADLIEADPDIPLNSTRVHIESSVLAWRLQARLAEVRTSALEVGSMLVDKRLGSPGDVAALEQVAAQNGHKLNIYDIDAPLESSLLGVLGREAGGKKDPIPPFADIADRGFVPARTNRREVIQKYLDNPELGEYELYGTLPSGAKVKVAAVKNGELEVFDQARLEELLTDPTEQVQAIRQKRITEQLIDELTAPLDKTFAAKVRQDLVPYIGYTWEEAIAHHASKSASGGQ